MTTPRPGFACCPACRKQVLLALAASGRLIAFDAAFEDGPWAVRWDATSTPRCRSAGPSGRVADDEYRYALHAETCGLADVREIASAPSARRRPVRPAAERQASAR
jgi:hypothetical protein